MKQIVAVLLTVLVAFYSVPILGAQPNMFDSQKECDTALLSRDFSFYEAKYFGLKDEKPINGTTRVLAPLERDACVLMLTTGGRKWVPQKSGTEFRAHRDEDNNLTLYARNDCGNPVYGVSYPKPAPPVLAPAPSPVEPLKLDIRVKYDPLPIGEGMVVKKKNRTVLYVIGGILLAGGIAALASGGGKDKPRGDGNTIP